MKILQAKFSSFYNNSGVGNGKMRWINIAKGIGICLVVIGHFNPIDSPTYWGVLNSFLYTFHMPLFFFISGYLYKYIKNNYFNSLKTKFQRLGIPFITIAFIYFLLKLAASYFVKLDYPVNVNSILKLLDNPVQSFVPLLWFVHALLGIFLIYPLIRSIFQPVTIFITTVIVAIFIDFMHITIPFLSHAIQNIPYFAFGVVSINLINKKNIKIFEYKWIFFLLFLLMIIVNYYFKNLDFLSFEGLCVKYLQGFLGIIAAILLSITIEEKFNSSQTKFIEIVGICSMSIYLFHTIFESLIRILFRNFLVNLDTPFLVVALLAIFVGLFMPMTIEIYVLRKSSLFSQIFLGLKLTSKS